MSEQYCTAPSKRVAQSYWKFTIYHTEHGNDHVLTMVDHGQNTINLGHGQIVAYDYTMANHVHYNNTMEYNIATP